MVKWIKTEVRGLIFAALAPVLAPAGFRAQKRREAFVRKLAGGRQDRGVSLVDHNPLFNFSLIMCSLTWRRTRGCPRW